MQSEVGTPFSAVFLQPTAKPSGSPTSGLMVVEALQELGAQVHVIFAQDGSMRSDYEARGCTTEILPHGQWLAGGYLFREHLSVSQSRKGLAMPDFHHVLMTRFNVRINWNHVFRGNDVDWLEERFRLFERYCFASVQNQTVKDFLWLVFFDAETPDAYRARLEAFRSLPCFKPVFVRYFDRDMFRKTLAAMGLLSKPWLITSRLDNDDAIPINYIERVQNFFDRRKRCFINFQYGLVLRLNRLYLGTDPTSHFVSLIEESSDPLTVCVNHTVVHDYAPVVQLDGLPGWLEVRHPHRLSDKNVCPSWKPVPKYRFRDLFPAVPEFREHNIVVDQLVCQWEKVCQFKRKISRRLRKTLLKALNHAHNRKLVF